MRLSKLEIKGFKSFRDKTVLEFPDNLTAIVGPNGSGKSNLTEAICFVLGRSRGLRAANLQELIYNGGISDKAADKAVVSIELVDENNGRYKITRIVDTEGRSTYNLNDKRVTRTRIVDIVGDNEYNIILQDDVTKVIEMKSPERREVIDSLCGIAEYDEKKAKAIKELEKVEKLINETHIVLGEKQGYMNELKKERDEALEYQNVTGEIKRHSASMLFKEIKSIEKRNEKLVESMEALKQTKEGDTKRVSGLREKIVRGNQELKRINSEIINLEEEKSRQRIIELNGEIGRREDHIAMLNEKLVSDSENKVKRKTRKQMLEDERKEVETQLGKVREEAARIKGDIEKEVVDSSEQKLEKEIEELQKRVYEIHSQAKTLKELNIVDQQNLEDLRKDEELAGRNLFEIAEKRKSAETRLKEQKAKVSSTASKLAESKKELDSLRASIRESEEALEKTRVSVAEKRANLKALEQASHGLKSAITAVLKIKDVVPGIHGPVFQLGNVAEEKYETALQIAAGEKMQNIVVENVDVAGKCIDYLRKKEVGRATFLPLDKINTQVEETPPKEAIGFARDFIKTEKKYKKIFDYVFENTIIVGDMNDAKKVGIGRWRMVTIEGDLFEASGAITGGHTKKIEIGFSNLELQEKEITELEGQTTVMESEIQKMFDSESKLKNAIAKLEMDYSEDKTVEGQLSFEQKALSEKEVELKANAEKLKKKLAEMQENCDKRSESIKTLGKELEEKERQHSKLVKARGGRDTSVLDKLKDKARDTSIEENTLLERKSLLEAQMSEASQEIEKLEADEKTTNADKTKVEEALKKLREDKALVEKESAKVIKEIEDLIQRRGQIETEITASSEEIGALERSFERVNEEINQVVIEKTKSDTQLEGLNKEFEKYAGVEVLDKSMKELKEELEKLEERLGQFGSINMRAIETFEQVKKEYEEIFEKLSTLKTERQSIFDFMDKVEQKKYETFMKTFEVVKENFERIFAKLSDGQGTLMLDNPTNISESGLLIRASPGGKKVMSLDAMSGGEKVLTSAAFLLAVQQYKPSDFYLIDELDAALDKINSIKLTEMLRESTTQFILVTHNDAVLKQVNSVIGVSMTNGISQVVGVKLAGVQQA
ncbi:MAG: chromosome segregation protein SMC [Candidatus Altiarchaeales archaeon]|nr:chromosome segregation protein SMC [Candidatus Altiarchaeales archaeon]